MRKEVICVRWALDAGCAKVWARRQIWSCHPRRATRRAAARAAAAARRDVWFVVVKAAAAARRAARSTDIAAALGRRVAFRARTITQARCIAGARRRIWQHMTIMWCGEVLGARAVWSRHERAVGARAGAGALLDHGGGAAGLEWGRWMGLGGVGVSLGVVCVLGLRWGGWMGCGLGKECRLGKEWVAGGGVQAGEGGVYAGGAVDAGEAVDVAAAAASDAPRSGAEASPATSSKRFERFPRPGGFVLGGFDARSLSRGSSGAGAWGARVHRGWRDRIGLVFNRAARAWWCAVLGAGGGGAEVGAELLGLLRRSERRYGLNEVYKGDQKGEKSASEGASCGCKSVRSWCWRAPRGAPAGFSACTTISRPSRSRGTGGSWARGVPTGMHCSPRGASPLRSYRVIVRSISRFISSTTRSAEIYDNNILAHQTHTNCNKSII
jgi:hypothetical protein